MCMCEENVWRDPKEALLEHLLEVCALEYTQAADCCVHRDCLWQNDDRTSDKGDANELNHKLIYHPLGSQYLPLILLLCPASKLVQSWQRWDKSKDRDPLQRHESQSDKCEELLFRFPSKKVLICGHHIQLIHLARHLSLVDDLHDTVLNHLPRSCWVLWN